MGRSVRGAISRAFTGSLASNLNSARRRRRGAGTPESVLHRPPQLDARVPVQRWQLEVTFEEARRRQLGRETQRQWSGLAIARTTPALLGLFSLVMLSAEQRLSRSSVTVPLPAWSHKDRFTFADALALVRRELWACQTFGLSSEATDTVKVPRVLLEHLTDTLCYAA